MNTKKYAIGLYTWSYDTIRKPLALVGPNAGHRALDIEEYNVTGGPETVKLAFLYEGKKRTPIGICAIHNNKSALVASHLDINVCKAGILNGYAKEGESIGDAIYRRMLEVGIITK